MVSSLFLLTQCACSGTDAFVAFWIRAERKRSSVGTDTEVSDWSVAPRETLVLIGSLLLTSILLVGSLRTILFQCSANRSSAAVHRAALEGVLATPIRFFETNPSGRILNKFSRDLGAMDVQLPKVMLDTLQMLLIICGAASVVLFVNPWFVLPLAALLAGFKRVRTIYLETSIHLRRLDGISE